MDKAKKELFSDKVRAGNRTYFFDVKESSQGAKYLTISESKKDEKGNYRHSRVMVFEECASEFRAAVGKAIRFMGKVDSGPERGVYARSHLRWSKEEDVSVKDQFAKGKQIDELSKIFQRKPTAIANRLNKLGVFT